MQGLFVPSGDKPGLPGANRPAAEAGVELSGGNRLGCPRGMRRLVRAAHPGDA